MATKAPTAARKRQARKRSTQAPRLDPSDPAPDFSGGEIIYQQSDDAPPIATMSAVWRFADGSGAPSLIVPEAIKRKGAWGGIEDWCCQRFGHPTFDGDTWDRLVKLTEAAGMTPEGFRAMPPAELLDWLRERAGSNLTTLDAGGAKTTNDTKDDTEKKSGKKLRKLNDAARACIRDYLREVKRGEKTSIEDVVNRHCSENGGSETGIVRRINDHPEEWKTLG